MIPVSIRSVTCVLGIFVLGLGLGLVSCTSPPPSPPPASAPPQASTDPSVQSSTPPKVSIAPTQPPTNTPTKPLNTPQTQTSLNTVNTVPVIVYHMDDRCEKLVKKTENFPKDQTLEKSIGSVLNHANTADFTITDYRVTTKDNLATIVLRLPAGSKRSFASMSSCEQMSYFGAMRETIVQRKEWGITDVKFTDGKKEIQF